MISGELMFVIMIAAIVTALTPSTIGVLIQLCSVVLGAGKTTPRMLWTGITFIFSLFATSLLLGILMLWFLHTTPMIPATYLALGAGILIVYAGLIEIKDYFWYGRGFGLRMRTKSIRRIKKLTKGNVGIGRAATLGVYTAYAALPSTCAPYIAILFLLKTDFDATHISLLALYNIIFVLPLIGLLLMTAYGVKLSTIQHWKEDGKGRMRLGVGLLLIMLGWILLLTTNGVLNLG